MQNEGLNFVLFFKKLELERRERVLLGGEEGRPVRGVCLSRLPVKTSVKSTLLTSSLGTGYICDGSYRASAGWGRG